jgi:hypothetical protein
MVHTACLICLISTVNGRIKKEALEDQCWWQAHNKPLAIYFCLLISMVESEISAVPTDHRHLSYFALVLEILFSIEGAASCGKTLILLQ